MPGTDLIFSVLQRLAILRYTAFGVWRGRRLLIIFLFLFTGSLLQMLVQVPYVVPSWCLEALKRRLKFSAASGSGGLTQNLFTAIAVMLKTNKLKLRDVLAQLAPEFDCLPSTKEAYEPLVTAMSAAARPASKGLYGENLDLDVTDRDTGASYSHALTDFDFLVHVLHRCHVYTCRSGMEFGMQHQLLRKESSWQAVDIRQRA